MTGSARLPENLALRPATPADAGAIAALEAAAFARGKPAGSPATWAAHLRQPATSGLVLVDPEGGMAGFCIWQEAAGEVELLSIAVAPAWRDRGLGGFLLDSMTTICRSRGCRFVFLEVAENNTAARKLYLSRGFVKTGRRRAYYRFSKESHKDAILMRLSLEERHG